MIRIYLFIDKVDAKLFKSVELENLKTGNIEDTDEVDFLHGWVKESAVTHVHQVAEEATKDILDDRSTSDGNSVQILGFVHPFGTNLKEK